MRMVLAGGGTGGHLFPGLAVAEFLAAAGKDTVLFVGSSFGIEAGVIPSTRFAFRPLPVQGLRGRGWRGVLQSLWRLPPAIIHAWSILGEFRAQIVVGLGGYASFPVVVAAWLRRVPSVLLEQNARPGLANRVLAYLARRVCTAFPDSGRHFAAGKVVQTGNPVRALSRPARDKRNGLTVLVFGGSQGAHRLNAAMVGAAPVLRETVPGLTIIHQTGDADCEATRASYRSCGVQADVRPFIDDMGEAYAAADLVVCRAGATTVAELTFLGKPAILVPYPHAADDHQRANAEVLAAAGAAVVVLDRELAGPVLATVIGDLGGNSSRLLQMSEAARRLAVPDAAQRVVRVCREVLGEMESHG